MRVIGVWIAVGKDCRFTAASDTNSWYEMYIKRKEKRNENGIDRTDLFDIEPGSDIYQNGGSGS